VVDIEVQTKHRTRRTVLIGLVLLVLLLVWLFSCHSTQRLGFDGDGRADLGDTSFTINGDTTEAMSPGLMVGIDLRLTNGHARRMQVSDLAVAVASVSAPRADPLHPCSVADFAVVQPAGDLQASVPAHTTSSFSSLGVAHDRWPQVGMLDRSVNQDGCKGAIVTLSYSGSGTLPE
jgi:hypothetical protein